MRPRLSRMELLRFRRWRWLAAIGGAAAFALARILPFAAVITGLASALAFAGVLPLAGVLVGLRFAHQRNARLSGRN